VGRLDEVPAVASAAVRRCDVAEIVAAAEPDGGCGSLAPPDLADAPGLVGLPLIDVLS
jgi:hypothetical protein